ncbi:MAG: DNA methyltransferase [Thermoflexales bacterium]|nr:DNA methyltransferase [Thermoflexales bacterium]
MIAYLPSSELLTGLRRTPPETLDVAVLITATDAPDQWLPYLEAAHAALRAGGLLFIQGVPEHLPMLGVQAERLFRFKYWIALESALRLDKRLPSAHAGVLLFVKGEQFHIKRVRIPHQHCRACHKPLKDWGGKSHLMHPSGAALSDVWKHLPKADNYSGLSRAALDTIMQMLPDPSPDREIQGVIGPAERILEATGEHVFREVPVQYARPLTRAFGRNGEEKQPHTSMPLDCVIQGDALEVLSKLPDESVDLAFADPPYNLDKAYGTYHDERDDEAYLNWCNAWLDEYVRVLKPNGALFVLNLPRWAMHHAVHLNQRLHFQNWIVWDALSEPRGKLMPAHYALLFYTKHPRHFKLNLDAVSPIDARDYCLRSACIRRRKSLGDDEKEPLTDIWWDIHRIKHRRNRDYHPCQLPEALLERIILLTTDPDDVVLDAMAGTGTTAVVASRLGRHFIAIDLDPAYTAIARDKLRQLETFGNVPRFPTSRHRQRYHKKALQLELRDLALRLGRLPQPEDVQRLSRYGLEPFLEAFPSWGKALKAAKLLELNGNPHESTTKEAHL